MGKVHQHSRQDVWKSITMDSGVQSVMIALEHQMHLLLADSLVSPHTADMELWAAPHLGKLSSLLLIDHIHVWGCHKTVKQSF